ncbi:MAG TPA: FAD-binding protein, partial [Agriterribacter sp.]|nr:FAD-binding protein [Agriterribacter sp.]
MKNNWTDDLKARLQGDLILPSDPGYDESRKVYNGMIDKHPAAIACCKDVDDVITCVNFARENDILLAVRGGGHNAGGLGIADDALIIDLSLMKAMRADNNSKTVKVQGGCLLKEVDTA